MQFQHARRAGFLVQSVDVLRDDGLELSHALKRGERLVAIVRSRFHINEPLAVKIEELLRAALEKRMRDKLFGRNVLCEHLAVDSCGAAKIGNARFRRNAGAAEEYDVVAFLQ